MLRAALLALATAAGAATAASAADGDLMFGDARIWGGWAAGGGAVSLGLMAGDLAYDRSVGCAGGLVVGLRLNAARVAATVQDGDDLGIDLLGAQIVGGLGLDWGKTHGLELLGGYGAGIGDERGGIATGRKDDRYHQWLVEATWLRTWRDGFQAGISAGYENYGLEWPRRDGSPGMARATPVTLRLVLGTRL